jgi:peptide/nickel transport system permease protein
MRLLRSELINTFQQDYIWFARAKGLGTGAIVRRHALRPSSVGVITVAGVTMGRMIGGTVMVESIFALPGLGGYTIDAITHRDFLSLQGAIVVFTVAFVIINFLVDILYGVLDPRTRI